MALNAHPFVTEHWSDCYLQACPMVPCSDTNIMKQLHLDLRWVFLFPASYVARCVVRSYSYVVSVFGVIFSFYACCPCGGKGFFLKSLLRIYILSYIFTKYFGCFHQRFWIEFHFSCLWWSMNNAPDLRRPSTVPCQMSVYISDFSCLVPQLFVRI